MDCIDVILTRRSIRKFERKPISEEIVLNIIKAGMYAPSARNQQDWQFTIINDRKLLNELTTVHPYSQMLNDVSIAILICGDLNKETSKGFWIQDCSAATQNVLLAAHSYGLGAVWLGLYPREDRFNGVKKVLNLPEHIIPLSLIPIGISAETVPQEERFDANKLHYNKW